MDKIVEMLLDGWSVDFTCYGCVGFEFRLLEFGHCVLTAYDLDSFIKHSLIILTKEHYKER